MKATIYHNPNCGTSRNTLAILNETPGVEVEVIEYLKTPPSRAALARLYERAGLSPRDGLRMRGTPAEALGQWFPRVVTIVKPDNTPLPLIERPIVETEKGVRLCRPKEKVMEIL